MKKRMMISKEAFARLGKVEKKMERIKAAWFADANGEEIIFPDVEPGDNYGVGDKVELVDDKKPTFERVMPDGSTIIAKNGILTEIIEAEKEEEVKAQKVFTCALSSKTVEIFGNNPEGPFVVGNRARINGQDGINLGAYRCGDLQVFVNRGRICAVRNVGTTVRQLFKSPDSLQKMKKAVGKA